VANYSYVVTDFPGAADPLARGPRQIFGIYHALLGGLRSTELAAPPKVRDDPERSGGLRFPDLWTARLLERGGIYRATAFAVVVILLIGLAWGVRSISRQITLTT
jgi:hypothetical protein